MSNNRILILVPEKTAFGGTTTYYKNIEDLFSYDVKYLTRGKKRYPYSESKIKEAYRLFYDFIKFIVVLPKFNIIHINTSLRFRSLLRDLIYIFFARFYKKRIVLTFHAWDETIETQISRWFLSFFKFFFFRVDSIIVLSSKFKNKLMEWGYKNSIYIETTIVDKGMIINYDKVCIEKKFAQKQRNYNLLFLARIEKAKGIYEAIDTFELLKMKFPDMIFDVVGDGLEIENVKMYAAKKKIEDVNFHGFMMGSALVDMYTSSDLYFFPSYSEGMPTSVLEAMAFGLPIVTRNVGGLVDFFEHGKMGYITDSYDPQKFCYLIEQLIINPQIMKQMSFYNYDYAKKHFLSDIVVKRLEAVYSQMMKL